MVVEVDVHMHPCLRASVMFSSMALFPWADKGYTQEKGGVVSDKKSMAQSYGQGGGSIQVFLYWVLQHIQREFIRLVLYQGLGGGGWFRTMGQLAWMSDLVLTLQWQDVLQLQHINSCDEIVVVMFNRFCSMTNLLGEMPLVYHKMFFPSHLSELQCSSHKSGLLYKVTKLMIKMKTN